jgi:hypothetical protein
MRFKSLLILSLSLLCLASPTRAQSVTVYGQPNATSNAPGHDANTLNFPLGVAVDAGGGLYVADRNNHRVLYYAADGNTTADKVYGQHGKLDSYVANFDGQGGSGLPSADSLSSPTYVALDKSGGLYVADRDNHRVLYYAPDGDTTADRVYGQFGSFRLNVTNNDGSGLLSGVGSPSADNLGVYALTIAVDGNDALYIADSSNHRVLYFANDGNTTADRVYGQRGNFGTGVKNIDGAGQPGTPSAHSLNFPRGMAFTPDGGLYIADRDNNRVLFFAPDGDTTADRVYGQFGKLDAAAANNDGNGAKGAASAQNLTSPRALALDAKGGLYVADSGNNRVLYFAPDGDATADWVYGQFGSFTSGVANNDGSGASGQPSADNLAGIQGLALADGKLYLSDTANNRVVVIPTLQ